MGGDDGGGLNVAGREESVVCEKGFAILPPVGTRVGLRLDVAKVYSPSGRTATREARQD